MGKKVKSARGEVVDFDLLKIKEQMASAPPPTDVRARQDFIDRRLRRRLKKVSPPAPKVESKSVDVDPKMPGTEDLERLRHRLKKVSPPAPKVESKSVDVDPKMPGTEDLDEEPRMIDEPKPDTNRSKQKARPPKNK